MRIKSAFVPPTLLLWTILWSLLTFPFDAGFASPASIECAFINPLIVPGADPSVVYHDGFYYLVRSDGRLTIAKSETISGLGQAEPVTVFAPPPGEAYSYDVWAPELEYIDGHWYIYVAATESPGNNVTHRMFVLQADTDDPQGSWTMQGQITDPENDVWAIDGSVFEYRDQLYMVWSGWPEVDSGFPQNLYIAEMSDPLTISGERHLIGEPDQPWEHSVQPINEGPQVFIHDDQLSLVFSADASWTRAYKLGMLVLTGDDPLDAASWTEVGPIFEQVPDSPTPIYGPGHNSDPVPSPDGEEWWFLYHAKTRQSDGWDDRVIYAQRFAWAEDGTPVLGTPIPAADAQLVPSGEPCGLAAEFETVDIPSDTPEGFVDLGSPILATQGSFSVAAQVQLADTDSAYAFVSQDGGVTSNFVLGFQDGKFVFTMFEGLGGYAVSAESTFEPEPGVWYHLVGSYDVAERQLALYVDAALQNSAEFPEPWGALGNTIIGAARRQMQRVDFFTGETRNVQLYTGVLSEDEVRALATE